jgi:hypothetical protein
MKSRSSYKGFPKSQTRLLPDHEVGKETRSMESNVPLLSRVTAIVESRCGPATLQTVIHAAHLLRTLMKDAREGLIRYARTTACPPPRVTQALPAQVQPCFITMSRQAAVQIKLGADSRLEGLVRRLQVAADPSHAGIANFSPRDRTAQAMRAFLAAMATIARQ